MSRITVALFKAESDGPDPYLELLQDAGLAATVIPTLQFSYTNDETLEKHLKNYIDFSGIIFTSPRSVKAVKRICDIKGIDLAIWLTKTNYSVGAATASLAQSLLNIQCLGSETGNSENLCTYILTIHSTSSLPYLFPCGNKRKDTLPKMLSENNIKIVEVECYETLPNSNIESSWKIFVENQGIPDVIVYFSPSGVEFTYQVIKEYLNKESKYVAIGPSTAEALLQRGIQTYTVALKPNAESVLNAIKSLKL